MAKTKTKATCEKKIYVLDTSVLLHDNNSLLNFQDNCVAVPITVLEELDNFKIGNDTKNYEARECIRTIDKLSNGYTLKDWIPLENGHNGRFKIVINDFTESSNKLFNNQKNDHLILDVAIMLQKEYPKLKVIMVTKDINLRIKAKALNIIAEDYKTGKVNQQKIFYTGSSVIENVDSEVIRKIYTDGKSRKTSILKEHKTNNHFYILKDHSSSALGFYSEQEGNITRVDKGYYYGIKPKNAEQAFAFNAILNPNIKLVTISGMAGTGKTLIALAGSIEQKNNYHQIILARPIIPLSNRDIGFLPGSAEDKVNPYMQPLWDNLKFIKSQFGENEKKRKAIEEMEEEGKIQITPLAFIRGRSLSNIIFIVDEAQNLTPHEVKTIITRAGENTKIILTGDIRQIDTPYLDEQSNGLSYVIDRLKGNDLYAHITLEKGERSELANLANDFL